MFTTYVKVINALEYDTGLQEISFVINHLDCMLGEPRAANACGKIRYLYIPP